jgi:hypothetical protein
MADLGYPTTVNSSTLSKLGRMVGLTILKNMKVTGKDYPFFIVENKIQVPNHQPELVRYNNHNANRLPSELSNLAKALGTVRVDTVYVLGRISNITVDQYSLCNICYRLYI